MSQLPGSPEELKYLLSEEAAAAATGQVTGFKYKEPKTPQQVRQTELNCVDLTVCHAGGVVSSCHLQSHCGACTSRASQYTNELLFMYDVQPRLIACV